MDRDLAIAEPDLGDDEWQMLRRPLESGWVTQGPLVAEFERAFAERHGVPRAIATTSCTTAMHAALLALGVSAGDEVIVPSFTWVATANVVLHCGATPVLADIERMTFNLDPNSVAERVTPRTKAVIPVHLFGLPADIDRLKAVLPDGVAILEDAACAVGASYHGRPVGSLGDAAAFSFHPRKIITTGEGGLVTTLRDDIADMVIRLRNHGASVPEEVRHHGRRPWVLPEFEMLGFNYRMTDLQGALGVIQLKKLDHLLSERERAARFYQDRLSDVVWLRTPRPPKGYRHGWQSFVCYIDPTEMTMGRTQIMQSLAAQGIATRPGTHAVHTLAYYRDRFGYHPAEFPVALDCDENTLAIPLHNKMTEADYTRVADALRSL